MEVTTKVVRTIPIFFCYKRYNKLLNTMQNENLALNTTALTHASGTIIMGLYYFKTNNYVFLLQVNSGGYFIFDCYNIIKKGKYDILRMMYIYHHIVVYCYILLDPNKYYWVYSLFFAEVSNIPSYYVYYNLKQDKVNNLIKKSQTTKNAMTIQLYSYAIIRIFIVGYYGLQELKHDEIPTIIYMTSILYLFGVAWFFAMLKQK